MNISELARRLHTNPEELREKLPELGIALGRHAIKIDDRTASHIMQVWGDMRRRQRLQEKMENQKALAEKQKNRATLVLTKEVHLPAILTVREFAGKLELPVPRVMQELMHNGIMASINDRIDFDTASILSEDLGYKAVKEESTGAEEVNLQGDRLAEILEKEKEHGQASRPPVIVVMGHVDHGKTKLLDTIRRTNVIATESGGITQHIGAYQVERQGRLLTFIDTPGHEAFTVMRSRGAKVADIAILVVAADDGVQPQTKEAVDIIRAAGLPLVVALNKIDRAESNIDRVKGELSELKLVPEDWGGDIPVRPVSAKDGTGVEDLLDTLILVSDVHQDRIQANPNRPAVGTIVESHVDTGEGPVATALIQSGTLHLGDVLGVGGGLYGRVRGMRAWDGKAVEHALPSTPVKIIGFKQAPTIGDILEVPEDAKALKALKNKPLRAVEEVAALKPQVAAPVEEGQAEKKQLKLVIRADVLGSLEAILGMLDKIHHEAVGVEVVSKGLGNITDADVNTAEGSGAVIFGFSVHPVTSAEELARDKHVPIVQYTVIYKLFEDVLARLQEMLPSEVVIQELGTFEVLANFRKTDQGWIVGGRVKTGKLLPGAKIRVLREGSILGEGEIIRLQLGKAAMKEAKPGQECGVEYKSRTKAEPGDIFDAYVEEERGRKLDIEGIKMR